MDARGQLGCDPWSAEGSCMFQTSFRPMYNQSSNFQHIIEKRRKQGKGIEDLLEGATFKIFQKTLEILKFQLLTTFSLIYSQKYCLIENKYISGFFPLIYSQKYCLIESEYISDFFHIYFQKYCLIENEYISGFFPLIYSQMNCLVDRCLNVLVISQIHGLTGPPNGCLKPVWNHLEALESSNYLESIVNGGLRGKKACLLRNLRRNSDRILKVKGRNWKRIQPKNQVSPNILYIIVGCFSWPTTWPNTKSKGAQLRTNTSNKIEVSPKILYYCGGIINRELRLYVYIYTHRRLLCSEHFVVGFTLMRIWSYAHLNSKHLCVSWRTGMRVSSFFKAGM